jgi:hypothetical protein
MKVVFSIFALLTVFCTLSFSSGQEEEMKEKLFTRRGLSLPPVTMGEPKGSHIPMRRHSSSVEKRPPLSPLSPSALNSRSQGPFCLWETPLKEETPSRLIPSTSTGELNSSSGIPLRTSGQRQLATNSSSKCPSETVNRERQIPRKDPWAPIKEEYPQWYADQITFQNGYPHKGFGPAGLSHMMDRDYGSSQQEEDPDPYWAYFP